MSGPTIQCGPGLDRSGVAALKGGSREHQRLEAEACYRELRLMQFAWNDPAAEETVMAAHTNADTFATATIASFAAGASRGYVKATCTNAHGLGDGRSVTITSHSGDYDGTYTILNASGTTFEFAATFTSTTTGSFAVEDTFHQSGITTQPDWCRTIKIKSDKAGASRSYTITGTNVDGKKISYSGTLHAAAGTYTETRVAFDHIYSVTFDLSAAGEVVTLAYGGTFGVCEPIQEYLPMPNVYSADDWATFTNVNNDPGTFMVPTSSTYADKIERYGWKPPATNDLGAPIVPNGSRSFMAFLFCPLGLTPNRVRAVHE